MFKVIQKLSYGLLVIGPHLLAAQTQVPKFSSSHVIPIQRDFDLLDYAIHDLDKDGDKDLIIGLSGEEKGYLGWKAKSDDQCGFEQLQLIDQFSETGAGRVGPFKVKTGDLDNDQRQEVIIARWYFKGLNFYNYLEDGQFGKRKVLFQSDSLLLPVSMHLPFLDFHIKAINQDQYPDITLLNYHSMDFPGISWLKNQGNFPLTNVKEIKPDIDESYSAVLKDLNLDGYPDLTGISQNEADIYQFQEAGRFQLLDTFQQTGDNFIMNDFNHDDRPDLLIHARKNSESALLYCKNRGQYRFEQNEILPIFTDKFSRVVHLEAFNFLHNGNTGFLINSEHGFYLIPTNTKDTANPFGKPRMIDSLSNIENISASDMDNDGDEDILAQYYDSNYNTRLQWYENLGPNTFLNDTTLCFGNQLKVNAKEAFPKDWSNDINTVWDDSTIGIQNTFTKEGKHTLTLRQLGCSANESLTDTFYLNIYEDIRVELGTDTFKCEREPIQLKAYPKPDTLKEAFTLKWFLPGDATVKKQAIKAEKFGMYRVRIADAGGCKDLDTIMVKRHPVPNADFKPKPKETNIRDPRVKFQNLTTNASQFLWKFGDQELSYEYEPVHYYHDTGSFKISLIAVNDHGCKDTVHETVRIKETFNCYVPSAFSPNGDGHNESFYPKGTGIRHYTLTIFNRWGQKVFQTNSMNYNEASWKGYIEGKIAPEGTYLYKIEIASIYGQDRFLEGTVRLLR